MRTELTLKEKEEKGILRIDDLGRIYIPKKIRISLNINEGDDLRIEKMGEYILIRKDKKEYMNKETGEILTYAEMMKQYAEDYDGNDPTNICGISEYYEKLKAE